MTTTYIALLRAVNVGGTGRLPMTDLKAMCEALGFERVRSYIASGNVIFHSSRPESEVKQLLEARLEVYAGKPVEVLVRTVAELALVAAENPFPQAAPNRTVAIFLEVAPPANTLEQITGLNAEEVQLGRREIYVHYGDGMADSKLRIPAAKTGTARNMNTVAKLVQIGLE